MPRLTTIKNLIEAEKIKKIEQETPTIPESERASSQCKPADHSIADSLFEEYSDGRGVLIWKGKRKRITDDEFSKFSELMKDKGVNNEN